MVAAMRSGRPRRRDRWGAPDGTHDFDLHLPDGRVIALEVTSSTVSEVAMMWDAINSLDWCFDHLTHSWSVSLAAARKGSPGTRVRRFHKDSPPLLEILGQEVGWMPRDYFGGTIDSALSARAQEAIAGLKTLGVQHGCPVDTMPGGQPVILVGTAGIGESTDGSSVNRAVQEAALANVTKLTRATADERHLLVWIDSSDNQSESAMVTFSLPKEGPELPDALDVVWVALWMRGMNRDCNVHSLWTFARGGHWQTIRVPPVRSYANMQCVANSSLPPSTASQI